MRLVLPHELYKPHPNALNDNVVCLFVPRALERFIPEFVSLSCCAPGGVSLSLGHIIMKGGREGTGRRGLLGQVISYSSELDLSVTYYPFCSVEDVHQTTWKPYRRNITHRVVYRESLIISTLFGGCLLSVK